MHRFPSEGIPALLVSQAKILSCQAVSEELPEAGADVETSIWREGADPGCSGSWPSTRSLQPVPNFMLAAQEEENNSTQPMQVQAGDPFFSVHT